MASILLSLRNFALVISKGCFQHNLLRSHRQEKIIRISTSYDKHTLTYHTYRFYSL